MRREATFASCLFLLLPSGVARAEPLALPPLPPSAAPEASTPAATTPAAAAPPPSADVTIVAAPPPPAPPPPPPPPFAPPSSSPPCADPPGAHTHDGFYFRIAQGFGFTSLSGTGPSGRTNINGGGAAGTILIGGTPVRGLAIGGGLHVSGANGALEGGPLSSSSVSGSLLTLGPFADFYPDPKDGWHFGLLAGLGGASVSQGNTGESSVTIAGTLFGGYDAWIGPQWSLGVLAAGSAAAPGNLTDGNNDDTGYRATPLSFVIEATLLLH